MRTRFEIKIDGIGVSPDTVTWHELRDLASSIEAAIRFAGAPESDGDDPLLGLVGIRSACSLLEFTAAGTSEPAIATVVDAVTRGAYVGLRRAAHHALVKLGHQAARNNWTVAVGAPGASAAHATAIISETQPVTPMENRPVAQGGTTIYCEVNRVGGPRRQTADVVLVGGGSLTISLADKEMAKDLGRRLFTEVCLEGDATWDTGASLGDWPILEFHATNFVREYAATEIDEAIGRISAASPSAWEGVDVEAYLDELRGR